MDQGRLRIYDPGYYALKTFVEFRDYSWNVEATNETAAPAMQHIPSDGLLLVTNAKNASESDRIDSSRVDVKVFLTSPPAGAQAADWPLCVSGDIVGRWIDGEWTPFGCRMQSNLVTKYQTCAAKFCRNIRWSGDSNSRRVLKSLNFQNPAERWCHRKPPFDRRSKFCECEDNDQYPYMDAQVDNTVTYMPVHGLTHIDEGDPDTEVQTFINNTSLDTRLLIIGNLVNWDAAFGTMPQFEARLTKFIGLLSSRLALFRVQPMMIVRTGMYHCCNSERDDRWYSRLRLKMFNEYLVYRFRKAFPLVKVWDPSLLGEARPIAAQRRQIDRCHANHFESWTVEADLNVLLNIMSAFVFASRFP